MLMMLFRKILVIALSAPAEFGCTRKRRRRATTRLTAFGVEERYVLHPGDVLDIQYRYTPEFNQTVSSSTGRLHLVADWRRRESCRPQSGTGSQHDSGESAQRGWHRPN